MTVIWLVYKIKKTAFGPPLELIAVVSSEGKLKSEVLGLAFGFFVFQITGSQYGTDTVVPGFLHLIWLLYLFSRIWTVYHNMAGSVNR